MTMTEAVQKRIEGLCWERHISINKLSEMCGINQSTLSNIIRGRNKSTTICTLHKICKGLGITVDEFFRDEVFGEVE